MHKIKTNLKAEAVALSKHVEDVGLLLQREPSKLPELTSQKLSKLKGKEDASEF